MMTQFKSKRSNRLFFGCMVFITLILSLKANALTITTNTTWTTSQTITGDLVIDNNATLTITGAAAIISVTENIVVKPGCKLVIKNDAVVKTGIYIILENDNLLNGSGAELYVNSGATLTSLGDLWEGVQVWGPPFYGFSGGAKAILKNATIEKARVGIATYKTEAGNVITCKGGVIQAENTLFRNNKHSIRLLQNPMLYANSQNGPILTAPSNSSSYFKLCHFLFNMQDNPFFPLPPAAIYFNNMIYVEDAKGVSVLGCLFEDQTNTPYTVGVNAGNSDVRVAPASATLQWGNYYLTYNQPCVFENMLLGVSSGGPNGFSRVVVQQSQFDNNEYPIFMTGENNSVLVDNKMTNLGQSFGGATGITSLGSSGYTIENNDINGLNVGVQGMYIQNSGEQYNEIYRNKISNTGISFLVRGVNRNLDGSTGLELLCNNFHENSLNSSLGIYVGLVGANQENAGIATFQGIIVPGTDYYDWVATGNLFPSIPGPANFNSDRIFKEPEAELFVYSYSNVNPYENPVYANVPLTVVSPNTCPTHFFPYMTYPLYLSHLQATELKIKDLNAQIEFTHEDSLRLSGLLRIHQKTIDSMLMTYMYGNKNEVRYDSMALALEQVQYGYYNKVKLAGIYLMQLRYNDAIDLLHDLPAQYSLTEEQITDVNNLADMYIVIDTLSHNGNDWDALPGYVKTNVENVSAQSGAYAPAVAKYLLKRYENIWPEIQQLPIGGSAMPFMAQSNVKDKVVNKIYPSPAIDYVLVDLEGDEPGILKLYSLSGNLAFEIYLRQGMNTIDIRSLASGIYAAQIIQKGKAVYQQKIIKK